MVLLRKQTLITSPSHPDKIQPPEELENKMKNCDEKSSNRVKSSNNRGSAILIVLMLSLALLLIIASQLNRGVGSKKLNEVNALFYEAKNAAESFAEYGCADIVKRFETKSSFPTDELRTTPITVPISSTDFYAGSNIDLEKTNVQGGEISDGYSIYLDPDDPRWEFDPMKGKKVFVRDVNIYAKATAKSNTMDVQTTAYVQQTLQVRDSPLFSNAIFYNLDLELHPGATMNIKGPVHTNQDAWLSTSDTLTFHDTVSASKRIMHGNPRQPSNIHFQSGHVKFINDSGSEISMKLAITGNNNIAWLDHNHPKWRLESSQKWDGNVQDSAHNVPVYNAAGIKDYIPDDPNTLQSELENYAYAIIEPLLPSTHTNRKTDSVRNQKMMAKAGLVLKVELDSTTETGFIIKAYKWSRVNNDTPVNAQTPFDGNLTLDGNDDPILVEVQLPDPALFSTLSGALIGAATADMTRIDNTGEYATGKAQPELYVHSGTVQRGLFDRRQLMEISPVSIDVGILRQVVDDNANAAGTNLGETYWKKPDVTGPGGTTTTGNVTYDPTTDWNGVVYVEFPIEDNSGGRTDEIVSAKPSMTVTRTSVIITQIPTGDMIDDIDNPIYDYENVGWGNGSYKRKYNYWTKSYTFQPDYNGEWDRKITGYQQIEETESKSEVTTSTHTVQLALQIINGEYIPSPTFTKNKGLTLATNAPMYLIGNYNADGVVHTNDSVNIENNHYTNDAGTAYKEPPASFMCDSFTLLSNNWLPANGDNRRFSAESNTNNRRVEEFTEVSAAILTGLMPTIPIGSASNPTGVQSGGAHNFPRFLEHWNGKTLTLRTSMVALFVSEAHTQAMPNNPGYYSPPKRDWGFNQNYYDGTYPPGTPNVRTFRRTTFKDISLEDYTAGITF